MYRCVVSVVCVDCLRRQATFQRVIDLPFIPTPFVELAFAPDWAAEVVAVVYEVETDTYHVELGDWCGGDATMDEMRAAMGPTWRVLGRVA